jgi:hypothetical protein
MGIVEARKIEDYLVVHFFAMKPITIREMWIATKDARMLEKHIFFSLSHLHEVRV